MRPLANLHVTSATPLLAPADLLAEVPLSERAAATVVAARDAVNSIIAGTDQRLLVVVGPCSIHDVDAAHEYARYLLAQRTRFADQLCILMRVYFEKPRTTTGWKGLINDPHLNDTYDMETGLRRARTLLKQLNEMGMPAASEVLDPIGPQYLAELISWAAIGARTIESQTHREMASGLSMPIGFKNGTDGSLQTALNALRSSREPHRFLGIDTQGRVAVVSTTGNKDAHLVLRGGVGGPNYDAASVAAASAALSKQGLCPRVMVDCSHDNSNKDYTRQPAVAAEVATQVAAGGPIMGVMIESHLVAGKQAFPPAAGKTLCYGQSITDGCVDLAATTAIFEQLAAAVAKRQGAGAAAVAAR